MLVKLEARKPWATQHRVYAEDELDEMMNTMDRLKLEGWEVTILHLGNITKDEYASKTVWDCYEQLAGIYSEKVSYH